MLKHILLPLAICVAVLASHALALDPRNDGTAVNGPDQLKKVLLARKDDFTRCLAEKLLTYALGRTPEPYDLRAVKRISAATASDGYKLTTLITEIVKSYPFRNRALVASLPKSPK